MSFCIMLRLWLYSIYFPFCMSCSIQVSYEKFSLKKCVLPSSKLTEIHKKKIIFKKTMSLVHSIYKQYMLHMFLMIVLSSMQNVVNIITWWKDPPTSMSHVQEMPCHHAWILTSKYSPVRSLKNSHCRRMTSMVTNRVN